MCHFQKWERKIRVIGLICILLFEAECQWCFLSWSDTIRLQFNHSPARRKGPPWLAYLEQRIVPVSPEAQATRKSTSHQKTNQFSFRKEKMVLGGLKLGRWQEVSELVTKKCKVLGEISFLKSKTISSSILHFCQRIH